MIDVEQPTPAGVDSEARPRARVGGGFRELGIVIALVLLCIFFWWRNPGVFTKPANLAVIMRFIATFGLLGIGEILVIITGGIDLSVGSMTALTGVLVAWLILKGVAGIVFGVIPVDGVRLFCYAASGVIAGTTGILLASRLGQGTPVVGSSYELWAIAATVIGGTSLFGGEGTALGAIVGAAIAGLL